MKKSLIILSLLWVFTSCSELVNVLQQSGGITDAQIASGLKEALDMGIKRQVVRLTGKDGFYKNELVKIHFPPELQKVENTLRQIGLSSLADKGEEMLNRAAEDAVKEAIPVFKDAIVQMIFDDARNILMGSDDSATQYLIKTTSGSLRNKFYPIIRHSFSKVGADKIWSQLIDKYNSIPLVNKVNPDLSGYVTDRALDGVFKMVAKEELNIRNNIKNRTTDLLKRVFVLQDKR